MLGSCVSGTLDIFVPGTLFSIFHMTLPICPVYLGILILRRKIVRSLEAKDFRVTKETRKLQKQLLRVLTIQACLPCVYLIAVLSYTIGQLGLFHHPILEYLTFTIFMLIPITSPLTYFIYVTPYRRCFSENFFEKAAEFGCSSNFE
ncbi:unnamed protein product [Caenorhabditis angaria]|uniref:G-protein coupled receptors family 1 profile domain-containing protein n=1 Tax=Caenorhabditis angaria TaxID=860376 RepID=A0A9P1N3U7_9PELO|nr:unnamed protein product [Caenorhabditis angaria]